MKLLSCFLAVAWLPLTAQISPIINPLPTREFGHISLPPAGVPLSTNAPNLVEGREFNQPIALAFDTSVTPPILYVVDSTNHRILAWRNPGVIVSGTTADKVIGQVSLTSTSPNGPGVGTGLNTPTAIAVDSFGNLYVADNGNNRILRYPKPFQQQSDLIQPDLVIGQKTFSSGTTANQGLLKPTAQTLALAANNTALLSGLAFDQQGNLWATDPYNNRVLRYPSARLQQSTPPSQLEADLVLGQTGFITNDTPTGNSLNQRNLQGLVQPNSLTFDSANHLYVSDTLARVLYFAAPASNGTFANRVLGVPPPPTQQQPTITYPSQYTLGAINQNGNIIASPRGLFTLGTVLFVNDPGQNRVVRYDSPDAWSPETDAQPSPALAAVYGQPDFNSGKPNRGGIQPSANSFYGPIGGAFLNNEMWIVDSQNNRVVAWAQSAPFVFTTATRLLGQDLYDSGAPNLVDGRGIYVNGPTLHGSGIVVDKSSTPNHLYVSDPLNHRVLGFRDVRVVGVDVRTLLTIPADLVIGQRDMFHTLPNYPGGDPDLPTAIGLQLPTGLAIDATGNLYVADTGNGRVLRFPNPFDQPAGAEQRANLVLGQASFTQKITDPSASTMRSPFGISVFFNGGLAVSDVALNRILLFRRAGDFNSGQNAAVVLGQTNFNSATAGSGSASVLNAPRGLAVDRNDRLFVADTGNQRVLVYPGTGNITSGASASNTQIGGLGIPEAVAVSTGTGAGQDATGEIWVAYQDRGYILRFAEFSSLPNNAQPTSQVASSGPIAIALDASDNLIAVELTNRITFYYAQLFYQHTATFSYGNPNAPRLAPNTIALLRRMGKGFDFPTGTIVGLPYPKELAGLQILVAGIPAPLYYVGPFDGTGGALYFVVPNNAPTSGFAEVLVRRPATGEILGSANFAMAATAPGLYTMNQAGTGQVAAVQANNADDPTDYSYNGLEGVASDGKKITPIGRHLSGDGPYISLYLTGIGHIDNGPPDGEAPGGTYMPAATGLKVNIGGVDLAASDIQYSGLSPAFPGLWQLNVRIPERVLPGDKVSLLVQLGDQVSNIGGTTTIGTDRLLQIPNGLIPTIAVK